MFLFNSHRSLSYHSAGDKSKDEVTRNEISFKFTSTLQTIMKNSNYDFAEREVYHITFLTFKYFTIVHLAEKLNSLASKISDEIISEEDKRCLEKLNLPGLSVKDDMKMNNAVDMVYAELRRQLKHCMVQSGFDQAETEETHKSCLSILSSFMDVGFT